MCQSSSPANIDRVRGLAQSRVRSADIPGDGTLIGLGVLGFGGMAFAGLVMASDGAVVWPCPWLAITGLNCPFCGATRMVMALFNGDLGGALSFNAPALVIGGLIAVLWLVWVGRRFGLPAPSRVLPNEHQRRYLFAGIAVIGMLFAVVRNLPWEPFTALSV